MLTLIGIYLYILAEMLFGEYAPEKSTNWNIFCFSSFFVSYSLITISEIIKTFDKFVRWLLLVCLLFFVSMLVQQLLLINYPYEKYIQSVNNNFIDLVRHLFIIISIFIISIKSFKKWRK